MPSKRKLDSARANGAKSHGPVTPEGRKISSMNALKHGLNARTVILPNEDDDEYNFQLESYVEQLQPVGLVEMDLVVAMVNARWRQRRCNQTETGLFEEQMVKQKEELEAAFESYGEDVEHSFAFRKLSDFGYLANLNRMQSSLERAYTHALRDLLRLQQLRESKKTLKNEPNPRNAHTEPRASASDPFPPGTPANPSSPAQHEQIPHTPPPAPSSNPAAAPGDLLPPFIPREPS